MSPETLFQLKGEKRSPEKKLHPNRKKSAGDKQSRGGRWWVAAGCTVGDLNGYVSFVITL